MRPKLIPTALLVGFLSGGLLLDHASLGAPPPDMKLQAQLVWGTQDAKPPEGKNYKPVEPAIHDQLRKLPLKWTNWFEVRRTNFIVPPAVPKTVAVSEKCELHVRTLDSRTIEVVMLGKGKEVARQKQALPKGEILVLGGAAPNATAWLVILRRAD